MNGQGLSGRRGLLFFICELRKEKKVKRQWKILNAFSYPRSEGKAKLSERWNSWFDGKQMGPHING